MSSSPHIQLFRRNTSPATFSRYFYKHPISNIPCTIRAYADHAAELGNKKPSSVHFFNKPGAGGAYNIVQKSPAQGQDDEDGGGVHQGCIIPIPTRFGEVHHEIEICILIGEGDLASPTSSSSLSTFDPVALKRKIAGIGLGLDLTLRSAQKEQSKEGLPWERAKSFERSACFTPFLDVQGAPSSEEKSADKQQQNLLLFGRDLKPEQFPNIRFALYKNGEKVQSGQTSDLSFSPLEQMHSINQVTRLRPGDVLMTGTPTGVGKLTLGDKLTLASEDLGISVTGVVTDESVIELKSKL